MPQFGTPEYGQALDDLSRRLDVLMGKTPAPDTTPAPEKKKETTVDVKAQMEAVWTRVQKQLAQIGTDRDLTPQAKQRKYAEICRPAIQEVEALREKRLAQIPEERKGATVKAYQSPMPKAEEAQALNYLAQVLQNRWKAQTMSEIKAEWQRAIDGGDLLTARVYRDLLPYPGKLGKEDNTRLADRTDFYADLRKQTSELLLTPEQKAAHETLTALQQEEMEVNMAAGRYTAFMKSPQVDEKSGEVIDGAALRQWQAIKGAMG